MLVGIALETPSDDALPSSAFSPPRNVATLTPARMWVVSVPATDSVPTTEGWVSQVSGWIPSFEMAPDPEPGLAPGDDASEAKLDSSFWNVAAGS